MICLALVAAWAGGGVYAAPARQSAPKHKASPALVNTWNPWKKGVSPRKFDAKAQKDPELPWTPDEAAKLTGKPAGRGFGFVREVYEALAKKFGRQRALNWYEYVLLKPTKFEIPKNDLANAWNFYGFYAFNAVDHARVLQTMEGLKKVGAKPGSYFAYRAEPSIRMFEDLKTFPRDVSTIAFPKENIWVKGTRTVHAKDYGWNATDATDAVQKALDDPKADIVVLDKMASPWLVTNVKVPSNKTLVFETGVRVHATEAEQRSNSRKTLIELSGGTDNQALIGKGDVVIGKYPDAATRDRYVKEEGGTGVYLEGAHNVLIRDLTIAECGCDGLTLGGCHRMNAFVYVENVVLDHNARQAMSMCNGTDVFLKNVRFLNTRGAQPMAGIDFEPSIQEVEATCNVYLIDCAFDNNLGGNVVFSESSTYPVTVLFKNCDIGSHDYGAIRINALCGLYQGNRTDAPSDIIFDGCSIKGVSWCPPVTVENANLFHVTFRDCDITEVKGKPTGTSPFAFLLNREYYNPSGGDRTWYQKEGSLAFDNVRITGWKGSEPLSFKDKSGHYSVKGVHGKVTMNGKVVDMTKFRYEAPDFKYGEVPARIEASELSPIVASEPGKAGSVAFHARSAWWVGEHKYELFTRQDGSYAAAEIGAKDAVRASRPGTAFRCLTSDRLFRLESPSTVYFEVPPGKGEAVLKLVDVGRAELVKGRDKTVEAFESRNLRDGYLYVKVKQQQKSQVYGLRATNGPLVFKFFAPYSGLVAADPLSVPHYVPLQQGKEQTPLKKKGSKR